MLSFSSLKSRIFAPEADRVASPCRVSQASQIVAGQEFFIAKDFTCSICWQLIEPSELRLTPVCGHAFCAPCIEQWLSGTQTCPLDRQPVESLPTHAPAIVRNILERVLVYCPHNPEFKDSVSGACDWSGPLISMKEHVQLHCRFALFRCPNNCIVSLVLYSREELQKHRKLECPLEPVECPNDCGNKILLQRDLQRHLDLDCPLQKVKCPNDCGFLGRTRLLRKELPDHLLQSCPHRTMECSFLTCKHEDTAAGMSKHLEKAAAFHLKRASSLNEGFLKVMMNCGLADPIKTLLDASIYWKEFRVTQAIVEHSVATEVVPVHMRSDKDGATLMCRAIVDGNVDLVKALVEIDTREALLLQKTTGKAAITPLITACRTGNLEVAKLLLQVNSSPKHLLSRDSEGSTALMVAAKFGHLALLKLLLAYDSSSLLTMARDAERWTVLMWASAYGKTDVVQLLLEANASAHHWLAHDASHWTALLLASDLGQAEVVRLLVHRDASPEHLMVRLCDGLTALMLASRAGHKQTVQRLLDADASDQHVMAQDNDGWTALIWASSGGHVRVVKLLLDINASTAHLLSGNNWTALMRASNNGHAEVVEALLDANASAEHLLKVDPQGRTALKMAREANHALIATRLESATKQVLSVLLQR